MSTKILCIGEPQGWLPSPSIIDPDAQFILIAGNLFSPSVPSTQPEKRRAWLETEICPWLDELNLAMSKPIKTLIIPGRSIERFDLEETQEIINQGTNWNTTIICDPAEDLINFQPSTRLGSDFMISYLTSPSEKIEKALEKSLLMYCPIPPAGSLISKYTRPQSALYENDLGSIPYFNYLLNTTLDTPEYRCKNILFLGPDDLRSQYTHGFNFINIRSTDPRGIPHPNPITYLYI